MHSVNGWGIMSDVSSCMMSMGGTSSLMPVLVYCKRVLHRYWVWPATNLPIKQYLLLSTFWAIYFGQIIIPHKHLIKVSVMLKTCISWRIAGLCSNIDHYFDFCRNESAYNLTRNYIFYGIACECNGRRWHHLGMHWKR